MKPYSLKKCKKILIAVAHRWRKKKKKLLPAQVSEIQKDLHLLQDEILRKNRERSSSYAQKCSGYLQGALKKSSFQATRDFIVNLVVALAFALLIRQMWFELYEIPTGSMRPTFEEKDRLIVSKTNFGINIPFTTKHFYFDPDLVKRSGIIVFSVEDMDVPHSDTLYFWVFPGKKQFVKRMCGKPQDTVYFYGGQLYGIDANGQDISAQLQLKSLDRIDHIPVIRFEGNISTAEPFHTTVGDGFKMSIIHQMNEPVARLTALGNNRFEGEMLFSPRIHNRNSPSVQNYYELWGMGNYAQARIVTKEEVKGFAEKNSLSLEEGKFYLELKHHPNLKHIEMARDFLGRIRPQFILETSLIELDDAHLKALFANMYTGRFHVKNGYAIRYNPGGSQLPSHLLIRLEGVADGTYEYYYGKAYQIKWQGLAVELGPEHPLSQYSADLVYKLFNCGIDFDKRLVMGSRFETERFAYFRNEELYVLGAPIFKKGEGFLESFLAKEDERSGKGGYVPFVDEGAPKKADGSLDVDKIRQYGLLIPPDSYLALGDNFAMSSDSRDFGFVPSGNLRGSPSLIFWPVGPRVGFPSQPPYPWVTLPNIVIWVLAFIGFGSWYVVHRRHHHLPLKDL